MGHLLIIIQTRLCNCLEFIICQILVSRRQSMLMLFIRMQCLPHNVCMLQIHICNSRHIKQSDELSPFMSTGAPESRAGITWHWSHTNDWSVGISRAGTSSTPPSWGTRRGNSRHQVSCSICITILSMSASRLSVTPAGQAMWLWRAIQLY